MDDTNQNRRWHIIRILAERVDQNILRGTFMHIVETYRKYNAMTDAELVALYYGNDDGAGE